MSSSAIVPSSPTSTDSLTHSVRKEFIARHPNRRLNASNLFSMARRIKVDEANYFEDIPKEILKKIFSYLKRDQLFALSENIFTFCKVRNAINQIILQSPRYPIFERLRRVDTTLSDPYLDGNFREVERKMVDLFEAHKMREVEMGGLLRNSPDYDNAFVTDFMTRCHLVVSLTLRKFRLQGEFSLTLPYLTWLKIDSLNLFSAARASKQGLLDSSDANLSLDLSSCVNLMTLFLRDVKQVNKFMLPLTLRKISFENTLHSHDFSVFSGLQNLSVNNFSLPTLPASKELVLPPSIVNLKLINSLYTFESQSTVEKDFNEVDQENSAPRN